MKVAPIAGHGAHYNVTGDGLAMRGYDPVAYFTRGAAREGSAEITHVYEGVTYQFTSKEHRELFAANPEAYKPSWAGFDSLTGELSGIPSQIDIGNYANIIISVTDGSLTSSLPAFSVDVVDTGNFSVTISWTPPSQNTDGTSLTNLTAYKIYYGLTEGHYPNDILIDNPGITTYFVANLVPNTYYFVATAISSNGAESTYSNVVIKDAG